MEYQGNVAKLDAASKTGADVVRYLSSGNYGNNVLDRANIEAMKSSYQQTMVPALAAMVGTGTIQKGDMEFIEGVMGDPGSWGSLDNNQKAKVASILQSVDDERVRLYGAAGQHAPQFAPGSSAWARSNTRTAKSMPKDVVFK